MYSSFLKTHCYPNSVVGAHQIACDCGTVAAAASTRPFERATWVGGHSVFRSLLVVGTAWPIAIVGVYSQQLAAGDPNKPRPPLVASADMRSARVAAVLLKVALIDQALQGKDTLAIGVLVPAQAVPDSERLQGQATGCGSVGQALTRYASSSVARGSSRPLTLDLRKATVEGTDPDSLSVTATLVADFAGPDSARTVRFIFTRDGERFGLLRAERLVLGICPQ